MSKNRNGRVQKAVRRAFIMSDGKPLSTSDLMRWAFPKLDGRYEQLWRYWSVHRAAERYAIKIGRADRGYGPPVLWAPNAELLRQIKGDE
jgi:hypothetical protein